MKRRRFKPSQRTILIAESWAEDKLANKEVYEGGTYLGSGYNKFGLRVSNRH